MSLLCQQTGDALQYHSEYYADSSNKVLGRRFKAAVHRVISSSCRRLFQTRGSETANA